MSNGLCKQAQHNRHLKGWSKNVKSDINYCQLLTLQRQQCNWNVQDPEREQGHCSNSPLVQPSMQGKTALGFLQKYPNLHFYGFGTTEEWVINDIIFIFGLTIPLMFEMREQSISYLFLIFLYCFVVLNKLTIYIVIPKMKICLNCTHPQAHPRHRWVCLRIRRPLEKCSISSLAHQWIPCSEWVPSEWESTTADKTSQ